MRIALVGLLFGTLAAATASTAVAQSDTITGLDAFLKSVDNPLVAGRMGTYPNGVNGLAFDTTICNSGSVGIKWKKPMATKHPMIAFLIAREMNGRFVQISDRSDLKHTFLASNNSQCATCTDTSDATVLAPGCSDTYSSNENGDRYWLAPASEVDPWLGDWEPICSHFDAGEPPVPPPDDCDGIRSLSQNMVDNMDPVEHRILVNDADLNVTGAQFYFWSQYFVRGEAEDLRSDTGGSREFIPSWNGSTWSLPQNGGMHHGTVLKRWQGARVESNTNGGDDGRVFLGSIVTGPDVNGIYHYEYAMNNRDNSRGIGSLQIPICPGATITNAGFRDIDTDASNDWTFTAGAAQVTWSTTTNPNEWNTIYNFWFDSDAAPATGRTLLSEFRAGAGLDAINVDTDAPMGPAVGTDLGFGKTGGNGLEPYLAICGGLGVGDTANLMVRYAAHDALTFAFISDQNGSFSFKGGTIVPFPPNLIVEAFTDDDGQILSSFAGIGGTFDIFLQFVIVDSAAVNKVSMTNALELVH